MENLSFSLSPFQCKRPNSPSPSPFLFLFPRAQNLPPPARLFSSFRISPLWSPSLSLSATRGPPVRTFPYPGSGTDSAESGRTPCRRFGLARTARRPAAPI